MMQIAVTACDLLRYDCRCIYESSRIRQNALCPRRFSKSSSGVELSAAFQLQSRGLLYEAFEGLVVDPLSFGDALDDVLPILECCSFRSVREAGLLHPTSSSTSMTSTSTTGLPAPLALAPA